MVRANNGVYYGLKVVFACLHTSLSPSSWVDWLQRINKMFANYIPLNLSLRLRLFCTSSFMQWHPEVHVITSIASNQKHANSDICKIITQIWPSCGRLWILGVKYHTNTGGHLAVFQISWRKMQPWSVSDRYQNAAIIDTTSIRHILLWRCICYLVEQ